MLALSTLYKEHLQDESCIKQENTPKYFDLLVKQSSDLRKSCHKGETPGSPPEDVKIKQQTEQR